MRAIRPPAMPLCYAAMMCVAVAVNLQPVFLTSIGRAFGGPEGLTHEQLGRLGASTFIGLIGGMLLSAPLADRLGARPFVLLGHALVAAGLAALGRASSYARVLAAVCVLGGGGGVLDMVMSPIVSALRPARRTGALNWLHAFYCVGAVATVLAASLALRLGAGWRAIALWMILLPAAAGAGFVAAPLPALVPADADRMRLRRLVRRSGFLAALALIFAVGAAEAGIAQWLPAYAELGLGFSKWTGGMALVVFSSLMAVTRIAVGISGHRLRAAGFMPVSAVAFALLLAAGCFLPWRAAALAACALTGLAVSSLWPSTLAMAADRYPHGGASLFGALSAAGNLGCVFMPWAIGVAADAAGMRAGVALAAAAALLAALVLLRLRRGADQPPESG